MWKYLARLLCPVFALLILSGCGIGSESDSGDADDELFQVATLEALSSGHFDGLMTIEDMLDHGDFGLGTFDALDGEMIVVDGEVYQVKSDGIAYEADDSTTTPFAAVTPFEVDIREQVAGDYDCAAFRAEIDSLISDQTKPYAIRVDGSFASMTTRSAYRQEKPYPTLEDALANQIEFPLENVDGTIAGFRLPQYMAGANAAGYHFHFVTDDRTTGGHVLDCRISDVEVQIDSIDDWRVVLATDETRD